MAEELTVAIAQADFAVGDVAGNTQKIIDWSVRARDERGADLVVFPELSICGYPPEDLLFHSGLRKDVEKALDRVRFEIRGIAVVVGYPEYADGVIYNTAGVFSDGELVARYRKQRLPNYAVFDEERYFESGTDATVVPIKGIRLGLGICEDIWGDGPARQCRAAGADCLLTINGSPYEITNQRNRERVGRQRVADVGIPLV